MPTYEYRCKSCDHEFEVVQSFTDDALTVCPECSGPLKKVFGNVGITFKGSGFYKTDSRSAGSFGSTSDSDRSDRKSSSSSSSDS
ncbi:MAG: FmdB family transcriptional regulator, partial [Acidimicrobiales bacterium]|nr:FmdB family transcriptional regulator [Acidimicrobiales bacterium]